MDRIKKYQENIIQFLEKYAQRKYANMPEVENQVIADLERNHFSLMSKHIGKHFFFFPPPSIKLLNSTLQLLPLTN